MINVYDASDNAPVIRETVALNKPFVLIEEPHPAVVYKPHVEKIIRGYLVGNLDHEIDYSGLGKCAVCMAKPSDWFVNMRNYLGSGISSIERYPICNQCDTDLKEEACSRKARERDKEEEEQMNKPAQWVNELRMI